MENLITLYEKFLNESDSDGKSFEEFAKVRLEGATKIAESAKEKGGFAMLTYHHFHVKLPWYKKASEGNFVLEKFKKELDDSIKKLNGAINKEIDLKQIEFQKLVGLIEVLGELIIKHNEIH